jgi:hypothetical protein
MRQSIPALGILLLAAFLSPAQSQAPAGDPAASLNPTELVNEWFLRLNALDDWWISMEGQEENGEVVDRFLELYSEDGYHQVSPSERQIGQVVYHGPEKIRHWADDFSRSFVKLEWRRDFRTQQEQTTQLVYSTEPPWGGVAAAAEFTAVYTTRKERMRMIMPGAVFFQFDEEGKIEQLRLYMLVNEAAEIEP